MTLAVGRHIRLPRVYRGRDIMWWLDRMGVLDERVEDLEHPSAAKAQPSLQLVGRPDHRTLDLSALSQLGVRLVGRAKGALDGRVAFEDDLADSTGAADDKLDRILGRIDRYAAMNAVAAFPEGPHRPLRFAPDRAPTDLDMKKAGIRTVIWATGFRRSYPWLRLPVIDARGDIMHRGGVTPMPGVYTIGMSFLRRRKSTYIDGVGDDARELTPHIEAHLEHYAAARAA